MYLILSCFCFHDEDGHLAMAWTWCGWDHDFCDHQRREWDMDHEERAYRWAPWWTPDSAWQRYKSDTYYQGW